MNFGEALQAQAKKQGPVKRRLLEAVANNPKASAAAEKALRNQLGLSAGQKVDYGALDWATLLPLIMQLLPIILALFKK